MHLRNAKPVMGSGWNADEPSAQEVVLDTMSPIRETCLSLNDVEEMIFGFERKYGLSSPDFFGNPEAKQRVPEDDAFRWEALIYHRFALKETYQEVQSEYLARLGRSPEEVRADRETQELLAA